MKAVIQRVLHAKVVVENQQISEIGPGILTLLGIAPTDNQEKLEKMISKILKLRIFEDENRKMNRSLLDVGGSHLIVSQFTLYGDTRQGNRPGFSAAAHPSIAEPLYEKAIELSQRLGAPTQAGRFGADMKITLLNDGPVTLILEQE